MDVVAYCEDKELRSPVALTAPVSRNVIVLTDPMSGFLDIPPGSSSSMSVKLVGCRCSMAERSIRDEVVMPRFSRAVTVTCPRTVADVSSRMSNAMASVSVTTRLLVA